MPNALDRRHQIVLESEAPASGVRERVLSTSPTLEFPSVTPSSRPTAVVRQIRVERLGSPAAGKTANDVEATSFLINTGDPRSTAYRFIAPRSGSRR